jgi:Xaa-Pro aminopeptidase
MSPLSGPHVNERLTEVRNKLADWEVDGILINSKSNRRWLSGFTGSAGWLLVTAEKALLATDFRYWAQASRQSPDFELFEQRGGVWASWAEFLGAGGVTRLGIEAQHVTIGQLQKMEEHSKINPTPLSESLEPLRAIKTEEEIEAIKKAAAVADIVMSQVNEVARPGISENELAWLLEKAMRDAGADGVAFPIIVAAGRNAAMAHHSPGERRLEQGDSLIVDLGALLNGYRSDLTRSFYIDGQPDEQFQHVYDLVLEAQETALRHMKAGMSGKDIDSLARNIIEAGGFGEAFGHSLGHGVGLDVHEGPRLSQWANDTTIPSGSVVTIEPGIYLPDWGGVRIEDLVFVTETGIEILSKSPKVPALG